jgi:hypothetical protein
VIVAFCPEIVIVADRAENTSLGAAVYVTVPEPATLDHVTFSHDSLLTGLHVQAGPPVTVIVPVPPVPGTCAADGVMVREHPAPACVIVNACPEIVTIPVRAVPLLLASTVNVTRPFPEPLAAEVSWIHGTDTVADHPQSAATSTDPLPPLAATLSVLDASVTAHVNADCVMLNT